MQRAVLFIAVGVLTHAGLAQAQGCAMSGGACICDGYDLTAVQSINRVVGPGTSWGDWQYTFDLCNPITVPAVSAIAAPCARMAGGQAGRQGDREAGKQADRQALAQALPRPL